MGNEMSWRLSDLLQQQATPAPLDLRKWVNQYAVRRYNTAGDDPASAAWQILLGSVYSDPETENSMMVQVPKVLDTETLGTISTYAKNLSDAWGQLLAHDAVTISGGLSYDLTDVGRAVLSIAFETA